MRSVILKTKNSIFSQWKYERKTFFTCIQPRKPCKSKNTFMRGSMELGKWKQQFCFHFCCHIKNSNIPVLEERFRLCLLIRFGFETSPLEPCGCVCPFFFDKFFTLLKIAISINFWLFFWKNERILYTSLNFKPPFKKEDEFFRLVDLSCLKLHLKVYSLRKNNCSKHFPSFYF